MAPVGMTLNFRALHAQLYAGRPLHQARRACNLPNMLHRLTVNCGGAGRGAWREGRLAGALWEAALSPAGQQRPRPGPWSGMRWPGCGGLHTYLVYRKCGRAALTFTKRGNIPMLMTRVARSGWCASRPRRPCAPADVVQDRGRDQCAPAALPRRELRPGLLGEGEGRGGASRQRADTPPVGRR